MAVLHQFDYIFAFGIIFAFLDAWNIGANDVANSFATSVSSRSLTLTQAMCIATVTEFLGALLVGSRVADTIRSKIISTKHFEAEPSVLMLGMVCALVGSSVWLTIATRLSFPVSTTHSIIGGVIGVGLATIGGKGVNWGWTGVSTVFAGWVISPAVAGGFGAILFLITKYLVLKRKNPVRAAMMLIPVYFALTSGALTMLIVWKGAPKLDLDDWSAGQILGCIFGVAGGVALICIVFFLPFLHRKLIVEDWTLKPWHIFLGPLLLRRGPVPAPPAGHKVQVLQDYYRGHKTKEQLAAQTGISQRAADDIEANKRLKAAELAGHNPTTTNGADAEKELAMAERSDSDDNTVGGHLPGGNAVSLETYETESWKLWYQRPFVGPWYKPSNLPKVIARGVMHGVDKDVVSAQNEKGMLTGNLEAVHARTPHFDNKTEHMYSFLQVLTAATASFAHGANDVSNAMGPLAAIYLIWSSGQLKSKSPVPLWVLAFGGASIVLGLWMYGYNIMRALGNRITLHSPTRGFSMELGAAITVIMATRLALPVSTTQCITGATVGVGLCTGDWRSVNWRMVLWIYLGWFITLPVTGLISGLLMAIIINAPRFGKAL